MVCNKSPTPKNISETLILPKNRVCDLPRDFLVLYRREDPERNLSWTDCNLCHDHDWNRDPRYGLTSRMRHRPSKRLWRPRWQNQLVDVPSKSLINDPTIQLPGMDMPRGQCSLLNRFRSDAGPCRNSMHEWDYIASQLCDCGEHQTMRHIVNECLLTCFDGGIFQLAAETKLEIMKANDNNNNNSNNNNQKVSFLNTRWGIKETCRERWKVSHGWDVRLKLSTSPVNSTKIVCFWSRVGNKVNIRNN